MDAFELSQIIAGHRENGRPYYEFFAAPNLSLGLYVLPAGQPDPQSPHAEDEVYYVLAGRGMVHVDGADRPVGPGSIVYVGAAATHRFHSITEELSLLVTFAPPRGSRSATSEASG